MYEPDKPRMMEVTDPNRDLFSWMRGEHGVGCYVPLGRRAVVLLCATVDARARAAAVTRHAASTG